MNIKKCGILLIKEIIYALLHNMETAMKVVLKNLTKKFPNRNKVLSYIKSGCCKVKAAGEQKFGEKYEFFKRRKL